MQLLKSSRIGSINYEVDSNKIMIQDLKSSVVSLKVSTSRIEREVKNLSDTVTQFKTGVYLFISINFEHIAWFINILTL